MPHSPTPVEVHGSSAGAATLALEELLPPPFACSWASGQMDSAWIRVAGELDISTTPQLEATLRESQGHARLLVLDLRELAFIDCSGVRCVAGASTRAGRAGRRLVVLRGRANVDRVFTLTRSCHDIEVLDLDPADEPIETLLKLIARDAAR